MNLLLFLKISEERQAFLFPDCHGMSAGGCHGRWKERPWSNGKALVLAQLLYSATGTGTCWPVDRTLLLLLPNESVQMRTAL